MQSRRQRKAVCGARDINTLRRASAERSLTCANAQELHIQPQVSNSMLERMPKRWTLDVERRNAASPLPSQSWVGRDCCRHATVVKPDVQSPRFVDFPSALPSPVSEQPTRAFSLSRPAQRQAATPSSCSRGYIRACRLLSSSGTVCIVPGSRASASGSALLCLCFCLCVPLACSCARSTGPRRSYLCLALRTDRFFTARLSADRASTAATKPGRRQQRGRRVAQVSTSSCQRSRHLSCQQPCSAPMSPAPPSYRAHKDSSLYVYSLYLNLSLILLGILRMRASRSCMFAAFSRGSRGHDALPCKVSTIMRNLYYLYTVSLCAMVIRTDKSGTPGCCDRAEHRG